MLKSVLIISYENPCMKTFHPICTLKLSPIFCSSSQVTYIHCSGSPNAKMDDYCWQLNKDHPACAKYLLDNEIHTDVEFRVGDAGELIRAHKLILMMRSPVFDRMFYGPVPQSNPVVIPDIEPEAFRALLR